MKKILLGTSALVGAVLVSQAAFADAPKITLGGVSEVQYGHVSEDSGFDATRDSGAIRNDNEISVKVNGKTDGGLGYGAEVWLEADVTNDADNQGVNASKTFLFVEGGWGRVEGGSTLAPDQTLKVDASSIARATGGIDGDWTYFASAPTGKSFLATPDLPINYGFDGLNGAPMFGDETKENISKIVYYTPKWNGLQAGLSYAPSSDSRGQQTNRTNNTANEFRDVWQGAIAYNGSWDAVTIGASLTGERGEYSKNATQLHDLRAYAVGAKLGYMGFSVAGSYGNWDDSGKSLTFRSNDDYWTAGAAYENGPYGVSFTYLKSTMDASATTENKFRSWSIGADYKLAPGLTPYIEYTSFDADSAGTGTANDNSGNVLLVGSALNF